MTVAFSGYASKAELLSRFAARRHVLHLGAIGCTLGSLAEKVQAAERSVHAYLTRISTCVGIEIDQEAVRAMTEAGLFDNLIAADVQYLSRSDIPLPRIDIIVAGDVIEHLSNPGSMLENMRRLSDPDTKLIVTTPNAMGLPNFMRYTLNRFRDSPDHVCTFNHMNLASMLDRHGWHLEQLYSCYQPRANEFNRRAMFLTGRWFLRSQPRFGGTLFAVARPDDVMGGGNVDRSPGRLTSTEPR
jgi:2-polyprenyl-3-methyl-5-hydroxy-6-metoxy-1,4-benzoquinol methylase